MIKMFKMRGVTRDSGFDAHGQAAGGDARGGSHVNLARIDLAIITGFEIL